MEAPETLQGKHVWPQAQCRQLDPRLPACRQESASPGTPLRASRALLLTSGRSGFVLLLLRALQTQCTWRTEHGGHTRANGTAA